MVKYVSTYTKGTLKKLSAKDLPNNACVLFLCIFSDFLYKSICWYSFELHQHVNAIQMSTNNIRLYTEVDKSTLAVI